MQLKLLFPNFFSLCSTQQGHLWQVKAIPFETVEAETLYSLVGREFFIAGHSIERVKQLGVAILTDAIALKNSYPDNLIFPYIQFEFGAATAYFFTGGKLLVEIFAWVSNALDDNLDAIIRNVEFDRLDEFLQSDIEYIKTNIFTSLPLWVGSLFYEARTQGGNNPIAKVFITSYLNWYLARQRMFQDKDLYSFSLCQMQSWAIQHQQLDVAKRVAEALIALYDEIDGFDSIAKRQIAMQFSSVDIQLIGHNRSEWCDILQEKFFEYLLSHERLQLFVNRFRGKDKIDQNELQSLTEAIEFYHRSTGHFDDTSKSYEQVQIFGILSPLLIQFSRAGNAVLSNNLIAKYFGFSQQMNVRSNAIHIIPNDEEGIFLCADHEIEKIDADPRKLIPRITETKSEFLNTVTALKDALDFVIPEPQRYGTPMPEKSEAFKAALKEHFKFDLAKDFLRRHQNDGVYMFSGINYPLQSIMMDQLDMILPSVISFEQCLSIREINKVLLWKGESLYSELECEGFVQLLSAKQIQVIVMDASSMSKGDFLASYHHQEFDFVWCCAHGEFDHYSPHKSYLDLGGKIQLSIDELDYAQIESVGRRIFFLNACDGATTSLYNSPLSIGIGQKMITSRQSLFSHLWPVHPLAAAIYAWLFAGFLNRTLVPTEIYCSITAVIKGGQQMIIATLEQFHLSADLVDRVRQSELQFDQFYYWGSLSYLE